MDIGHEIYLERREPASNMARFYALSVEVDLFGEIRAMRRWGRIGTRGRFLSTACANIAEAMTELEARAAAKRRRGYQDMGK